MKILVIGGGAREHALAWKLSRERSVTSVWCAPGNPGIASVAKCVDADVGDPRELLGVARNQGIDLTVVGPELPLSRGIVDVFTIVLNRALLPGALLLKVTVSDVSSA